MSTDIEQKHEFKSFINPADLQISRYQAKSYKEG